MNLELWGIKGVEVDDDGLGSERMMASERRQSTGRRLCGIAAIEMIRPASWRRIPLAWQGN